MISICACGGSCGKNCNAEILEIEMAANSKQVGGGHYQGKGIEPIDFIMKNNLTYPEGCVVKYISRHREKNGSEDLRKAIHYLEFILEKEYGQIRESLRS